MHRIDNRYASTTLPVPAPAGTPGFFTGGDPTTGQSATIVDADFLNTIQEEFMNLLNKGGITADKTNNAQVLQALSNLFTGAFLQITVSQNLLVPNWATQVAFRLVGGGGGGAHCQSDGTNYRAGGGGGSGAYVEGQRPCTPGQLLNAIVGTGGPSETNGGDTSLAFAGQWAATAGGGYASVWSAPNNSAGGPGGFASGGDLNSNGSFGGDGEAAAVFQATGHGADGPWGGGPRAANQTSSIPGGPADATGPGAGGAGVYDTTNSNNYVNGGRGANGVIQYRFLP